MRLRERLTIARLVNCCLMGHDVRYQALERLWVNKQNVDGIIINLTVDGDLQFFVLLAADGTINRLGPQTPEMATSSMLFTGQTDDPLFRQIIQEMPDEIFQLLGRRFELPERAGKECELTIAFRAQDGEQDAWQLAYGTESIGPPEEIVNFLKRCREITEPWYQRSASSVAQSA